MGPFLSSLVWYKNTGRAGGREGLYGSEMVSTRHHNLEQGKARSLYACLCCPCPLQLCDALKEYWTPFLFWSSSSRVYLSSSLPRRAALCGLQDLKAKLSPSASSHSGLRSQCPELTCIPPALFSKILLAMSFPSPPPIHRLKVKSPLYSPVFGQESLIASLELEQPLLP